jgi:hypothetical protein
MNPYLQEFELKERRRQMLAEANRRHLVNLYNARYPRRTDRFLLALAELLIGLGEKLKHRHTHHEPLAEGCCRE